MEPTQNILLYLLAVSTVLVGKLVRGFVDLPGVTTVAGPTVQTNKGPVQGMANCMGGQQVVSFLGVPYAKPPVGELRFKPPQQMDKWNETIETTSPPNSCPQTIVVYPGFEFFAVNSTSEDCLYLNVFLPSGLNEQANLPVMVWLHGGGFTVGSSTLEAYDGRYLGLQSQAIIVTVNYRLGFLGFMRMGDVKGNMGLLDQKAALEWVQANIAKFGGDPGKVTLFGQSAGASSVSFHLISLESSHLFDKAIMQSGSFLSPWSFVDATTAEQRSIGVAQKLGCSKAESVMDCLRSKTADEIVGNQVLDQRISDYWFVPTIDGHFIYKDPMEMMDDIRGKKPLLFGSNANEASLFTFYLGQKYFTTKPPFYSDAQMFSDLYAMFFYYPYYNKTNLISKLSNISHKYPPSGTNDTFLNFQTITNALSDSSFVCPSNNFASEYVCYNSYNYLFTQTLPNLPALFGATHGLELVFSFSTIIKYKQLGNFTENDIKLSEQIISFWSNFARNGNPNSESSTYPTWPLYSPDDPKYLILNEEFLGGGKAEKAGSFRDDYCAFWQKLNVKTSKTGLNYNMTEFYQRLGGLTPEELYSLLSSSMGT